MTTSVSGVCEGLQLSSDVQITRVVGAKGRVGEWAHVISASVARCKQAAENHRFAAVRRPRATVIGAKVIGAKGVPSRSLSCGEF